MRKNYILALLATGVVPMSAFAAINIPGVATDKGSWDLSGVSNVETSADGMITIPGAQGGYPACNIKNLPAGDYIISGDLINAVFEIQLNGKNVVLNIKDDSSITKEATFTTTESGNLEIAIKAKDMSEEFQYGNIKLAYNADPEKIQQKLDALLPSDLDKLTVPSNNMAAYNTKEITGADVIAEYQKLKDDYTKLKAAVAAINPDGANDEELLAAYIAYKKSDLDDQVNAYAKEFDEYENGISVTNDDVTVWTKYPIAIINDWADTLQANKDAKKDNLAEIPVWEKKLKDLVAGISEENQADLAKEIKAAQDAIQDAKDQIDINWEADGVQEGKADYVPVPMTAIKDAIDALDAADSALIDGKDNYAKWLRQYQELTNAYINAQQKIKNCYKDEEGVEEPGYKERVDSVIAGLTAIYNDAINGNEEEGVEKLDVEFGQGTCTGGEYTHDKALIEKAIAKLNAQTDQDAANLADEQQALKDGTALVDGLNADLEEAVIKNDAYKKADLYDMQAALEAEIANLQKDLDRIYASTDVLTQDFITGDFQAAVDKVQDKVDAFADQVAVANQLGALTTALNKARTDISNSDDNQYLKALPKAFAVDVVDMMNGSYESIQAAIEQQQGIYDKDGYQAVQEESITKLKKSIDVDEYSYLANGLNMAAKLAEAYQIVIPAKTEADALVAFIKNDNPAFDVKVKSSLAGRGIELNNKVVQQPFIDAAKTDQKKADDTIKVLQNTRTMSSPQNAFDAIESVMKPENGVTGLLAKIKTDKFNYLKTVIGSLNGDNSNLEELSQVLEYLENQVNEISGYAGGDAVSELYQEASDELSAVEDAFDAVTVDDKSAADKLVEINGNAQKLIKAFQTIQNEIDKVVKNHDAYVEVCKLVDQILALEEPSKTFADKNTFKPATDSWYELIDGQVEETNKVKADIDKTYNAVEMLKALTLDQTNAEFYTDELKEIQKWFGGYEDAVTKNEVAHNVLLNESGEVTKLADEVNKKIEAEQVEIDAAKVFEGYLSELNALDTDLYNAYKDLTCEGQEKLTLTEPATLMDQYEALKAKIEKLKSQLDSDYAQALYAYNDQFIKDKWIPKRLHLMDVYTQAIITLDQYRDIVNNCSSLAGDDKIQDGVDHQPVFEYAEQIQKLIDEVAQMFDNSWPTEVNDVKNDAQRKLTDADLKPYLDQAAGMEDAIKNIVSEKIAQINEAAEGILEAKKNEVGKLILDSEKTLKDAGCDPDIIDNALKEATLAYNSAENAIKADPDEDPLQYITDIANALNQLNDIDITDEQMQAVAVSTFKKAVAEVDGKIAEVEQTLAKHTELPTAKKQDIQQRINDAKQELNDCRNDKVTLENLSKTELPKVEGIGEDVESILKDLNQAIADNEANNAAAADLNDKVADLQANLDALNEWVEQLLVAADVPTTTLQAKITEVETAIEEAYEDELLIDASEVATLEGQIDAVQGQIDSTYLDAYKLEVNRLNEELYEANRAYNEAAKRYEDETGNSDYPNTDEGREYTEKIETQALALGTLSTVDNPTEKERNALLAVQDELLQIQIDLKYLTADDVLATLNEAAENAIATINASAAKLGNYAQPVYEEEYDALIADVEALQKKWTENEADRIVKEGVYLRDLNEIVTDKLSDLDARAAAYQADREANAAHEAASNAAYELLNADLTQVINAFNATTDNVQTYSVRLKDVVASMNLSEIAHDIDEAQAKLEAAKAEFTCEEFEWDTPLEDISALIKNANKILWKTVTTSYKAEASQAIAYADDALNEEGKHHVNAEGFAAASSALKNKLNKLAIVTDGSAVKGGKFVEAATQIIADAEALFKSIVEAEYIPGDITGTGSVTVDDYEALIDLLGKIEGNTEELDPAYDVNEDGSVTMADVASIIDRIMGRDSNAAVMARMPMINTNNAIYVVKTSTNNGISRYALVLNNTAELFGAQMDIILGQGMEIVNEGVAERTSANEFYGSTTYSGKHRIILSSIEMNTFVGSEGAIVYIDVRGEGELNLDNVLGVDTTGRMYNINVMTNVTGIESISADGKNADIFNVAGQKLNRAQRGAVNIIRTADGKTSKVINK